MNLIINGLLVNYERTGSGPVVVVLPGWADTSQSWKPVCTLLAQDYDVITINFPGFGGSQAPPAAWGLGDFGDCVAKLLQKLAIESPLAIIGHSNGGSVAITVVANGTIQPSKLVLLASAGIRETAHAGRRGIRTLAKVGKAMPLPAAMKTKLRRKLYESVGSDMLVAEHMQETFKKVVATDVQAAAATISIPTLLVYGDADTSTPPQFGETYNTFIKRSELRILPGLGHFLHVDEPQQIAAIVQDFLK